MSGASSKARGWAGFLNTMVGTRRWFPLWLAPSLRWCCWRSFGMSGPGDDGKSRPHSVEAASPFAQLLILIFVLILILHRDQSQIKIRIRIKKKVQNRKSLSRLRPRPRPRPFRGQFEDRGRGRKDSPLRLQGDPVFAKVFDSPGDFTESFPTVMSNRSVPARRDTRQA